ncbi:MAG: cytidine deaminase [Bacteroidales bacterium]|nr:cytidine deaminase [Bacteroidales bacterium]MCM1147260.1 cytidine deaminase [Bacteroidales bacterium]MCM1206307.1 cytidine deaminase [Bacillota bacterium]MCM1510484.1 cytidine deaminase [Clostridium sp.]
MDTLNINIPIKKYKPEELTEDDRQLIEKAIKATDNSYSPYSHFSVGACLLLDDGSTVIGANQENAAYPSGLCAERTAVFAAQAQHPDKPVKAIAIAARNTSGNLTEQPVTPCGSCRQVILEIEERYKRPVRILLYGTEAVYVVRTVRDLLPLCFVSEDMEG